MSVPSDRIHILHIDDEGDSGEETADALERADDQFDVDIVSSVGDGLERIRERDIDCIVSGYDLPERTGIDFLEAVREEYPDLPFVLCTGQGSEEIASEATAAGVTEYLNKGRDRSQYDALAARIRNAVEQYHSKRALEATGKRLSLFVEQSSLGVIEWNGDFELVQMNEAAEDILGYTEADLRGSSWEAIVPEPETERIAEVVDDLLSNKGGYHAVNENVTKDGERVVCEWHNRVITGDDGEVIAVFSQFQDVTERHEHQQRIERLHESTRELMSAQSQETVASRAVETTRDILELPINSVYLYDDAADALEPAAVSDEALELIGTPPTYEPGESLSWEVFETGEVRVFEDVSDEAGVYNPDTEFGAEIILPLGDYGVMYVATTDPGAFTETDVTLARIVAANTEAALSRVERERTLRESQSRYQTLVDNFPDGGVFLFDSDCRFVSAGGTELSEVGLSPADVKGAMPEDLFPADIAEELRHCYQAALDGAETTFEQEYDGKRYRSKTTPIETDSGEITHGMAVSQNVTEQVERRQELKRQNERLDEFTSIVSHDLRTPLSVASSRLELAADECDSEHLADVATAHERMEALITDLLTLARSGTDIGTEEPVALWELAESSCRSILTDGATLDVDTEATVMADRSRLRQLLENLVRNAIEHGGEGVTVTIGDVSDGFYVEDDGSGIPDDEREAVFDAGYSTSKQGTGFGLSIVKQVADAHGWDVRLTEGADGGARFVISGVDIET